MTKRSNKDVIYAILSLGGIILLLFLMVNFNSFFGSHIDRKKCPHKIEGNLNASFVIKYIDSPTCVWCWFEEPVLKKAVAEKGDLFRLERYDIRYCRELVRKYKLGGTPSFVFSYQTKEYTHWGYLNKGAFYNIICEVTGGCAE